MGNRLDLHTELLEFVSHIYFQPPSNIQLVYPCLVYNKSGKRKKHGNDYTYIENQQYKLTVIDSNPDSTIAEEIEKHFQHCTITSYATIDNINQTYLTLYY